MTEIIKQKKGLRRIEAKKKGGEGNMSYRKWTEKERKPRCRLRQCKKGTAGQNKYICERKYKDVIKIKNRRNRKKWLI